MEEWRIIRNRWLEGGGKGELCEPPPKELAGWVEYYVARYKVEKEDLEEALMKELPKKETQRIYWMVRNMTR
jgi:hypothetical protein